MVLKTFNLDEDVYEKFSKYCKKNGISMSKQINFFITAQVTKEPEVKKSYLKKLEKIRKKGKYKTYNSFEDFEKSFN